MKTRCVRAAVPDRRNLNGGKKPQKLKPPLPSACVTELNNKLLAIHTEQQAFTAACGGDVTGFCNNVTGGPWSAMPCLRQAVKDNKAVSSTCQALLAQHHGYGHHGPGKFGPAGGPRGQSPRVDKMEGKRSGEPGCVVQAAGLSFVTHTYTRHVVESGVHVLLSALSTSDGSAAPWSKLIVG